MVTADALLTQRAFARHLVEKRRAHYHFTVKGNQKNLLKDLQLAFQYKKDTPDATQTDIGHGRIETRCIWTTTQLNRYLDFPHVAQAFVIERNVIQKKTGKTTSERVYGVTSQATYDATPADILKTNRNYWS